MGIFGFDVLPDNDLKLWLIEVNKCPTMQQTTEVTAELVPRFMRSMLTVLKYDKPPTEEGARQILENVPDFHLLYESSKVS